MNFLDDLGTLHAFPNPPRRIVSLVPSLTELLCDLGLEDRIVGVTKFCVHPYYLRQKKQVIGGTKMVKTDKIRDLRPDVIIANKEENTPEIVAELSCVAPVWVTDIETLDDLLKVIADFGVLFNCRTEAQKWTGKIEFGLADFKAFMEDKPWRKTAYLIWKDPYMAAGEGTYINEMLRLNKFANMYAGNPKTPGRYPEIIIQKMRIQGDPDVVFLSSEPYPFKDEHAFEVGRFTHHAKTVFVDGEMFSWYGSRLVKAFGYFKKLQERITE